MQRAGGIFYDMLTHDFDMIHFLADAIPEEVTHDPMSPSRHVAMPIRSHACRLGPGTRHEPRLGWPWRPHPA